MDFQKDLIWKHCKCGCGKRFRVHPENKNHYSSMFCEHRTVVDPEFIKKRPLANSKKLRKAFMEWKLKLELAERIARGA